MNSALQITGNSVLSGAAANFLAVTNSAATQAGQFRAIYASQFSNADQGSAGESVAPSLELVSMGTISTQGEIPVSKNSKKNFSDASDTRASAMTAGSPGVVALPVGVPQLVDPPQAAADDIDVPCAIGDLGSDASNDRFEETVATRGGRTDSSLSTSSPAVAADKFPNPASEGPGTIRIEPPNLPPGNFEAIRRAADTTARSKVDSDSHVEEASMPARCVDANTSVAMPASAVAAAVPQTSQQSDSCASSTTLPVELAATVSIPAASEQSSYSGSTTTSSPGVSDGRTANAGAESSWGQVSFAPVDDLASDAGDAESDTSEVNDPREAAVPRNADDITVPSSEITAQRFPIPHLSAAQLSPSELQSQPGDESSPAGTKLVPHAQQIAASESQTLSSAGLSLSERMAATPAAVANLSSSHSANPAAAPLKDPMAPNTRLSKLSWRSDAGSIPQPAWSPDAASGSSHSVPASNPFDAKDSSPEKSSSIQATQSSASQAGPAKNAPVRPDTDLGNSATCNTPEMSSAPTAVAPAVANPPIVTATAASTTVRPDGAIENPPVAIAVNPENGRGGSGAQISTAAPNDAPALHTSPVQMAQMVTKAAQSEMRVELNTSAFGSVEVRTTVRANDVGILIGSEKGDLRSLLANELPGISTNLQQQNLRLNQVNFHQGFASANNTSSGGGESRSRFFSPRTSGAAPMVAAEMNAAECGEPAETYMPSSISGNLSVLA